MRVCVLLSLRQKVCTAVVVLQYLLDPFVSGLRVRFVTLFSVHPIITLAGASQLQEPTDPRRTLLSLLMHPLVHVVMAA